uniref:Uncharacterized protein n=1 Tax=Anguilla anguilla TaxID=7936 RepID=A0A0E9RQ39_ANGAN
MTFQVNLRHQQLITCGACMLPHIDLNLLFGAKIIFKPYYLLILIQQQYYCAFQLFKALTVLQ